MTAKLRFLTVGAVLAVVAAAGVAHASDGDPLIMGQLNDSETTTIWNGQNTQIQFNASGGFFALQADGGSGTGVIGIGSSAGSIGVKAVGTSDATGDALNVEGVARFSRSGRAIVPAGSASTTVKIRLRPGALALAVLQANVPGVAVRAVVVSMGGVVIYLNRFVGTDTPIAWFVING